MRPSIPPGELFEAIYDHRGGAFAHLMRKYPESAVKRIFEQARRNGWIECPRKMSHAMLTEWARTSVEVSRAIRATIDAPNDAT